MSDASEYLTSDVISVDGKEAGMGLPEDLADQLLGEVVDEIIYGDVSFLQGTVAILVIAAASDPASGSDNANAPNDSPRAMPGRKRWRCASEP